MMNMQFLAFMPPREQLVGQLKAKGISTAGAEQLARGQWPTSSADGLRVHQLLSTANAGPARDGAIRGVIGVLIG